MKALSRTLTLLSIASVLSAYAACPSDGQATYPFYCRGKMLVYSSENSSNSAGALLNLTFTKNASASGPVGNLLAPGSCAWTDRPVNAQEPNTLVIGVDPSYYPSALSAQIVTQCVGDNTCVFYGCASRVGNSLEMLNNPITRIYLTN